MWVFNIYLNSKFPVTRDELTKKLKEKNIDTRDAFVPINQQKILNDKYKKISKITSKLAKDNITIYKR